ncbi:YggS family pyridoxal phosphate-dependent enzyme [Sinomonas sp. ASV322]|uniref:YggS family pyridoxal phosphate-dependent enzyme n=1 Tax=Sinomonas sp. ASV322 TaxID=3041920 RepID=UPI0027DE54D9|nr:YggS family pyridoxal phosphate-dependent enzyme [Sinomonas sp. ASV322]MDQ4500811.1 YggS family pyridoxal phosphate-dependent enzyme [Sinomonas sp. ASV322]
MAERAAQSNDRNARREQLASNLDRVRTRIHDAARAAGRADQPELIVVTKFHPADDVRFLAELGVTDIGESRDQEASAKAAELGELGLSWHFIGQLQTNKAKSVVRYADAIHSVDRPSLVAALAKAAASEPSRAGRLPLACLVQVNLDPLAEPGRGGALPREILGLADLIASSEGLRLAGVMAVAPLGEDPSRAFARLADCAALLRGDHPDAMMISAGMSQDLEQAIAAGATHVRIGTDVLGPRPRVL